MTGIATFDVRPTFLGVSRDDPSSPICVAGIPLDLGTTNRAGARFGPSAIRQASRMLVDGDHPLHWVNPAASGLADIGNFTIALGDVAKSLAEIERQAARIEHLVALGGDHGITLPLLRALAKRRAPPALIHFDAHVDTWAENFGQAYAHGTVFYHAISEGLIQPRQMVQIGLRSPVERAVHDWTLAQGVVMIMAQDVHEHGPAAIAEQIRRVIGGRRRRSCGGCAACNSLVWIWSKSARPTTSPRSRRSLAQPWRGNIFRCSASQARRGITKH
jgi:arginase family enzyme